MCLIESLQISWLLFKRKIGWSQWRNGTNKVLNRIRFFWKLWRHCKNFWRNQKGEIAFYWKVL